MAHVWGRTGLSWLLSLLLTILAGCSSGGSGSIVPGSPGGDDSGGNTGNPPGGSRSTVAAQPLGTFSWIVDGSTIAAPSFVAAKGPEGATKNFVSRHQLTSSLSLTLYQRVKPGYGIAWLEAAIFNDPLVCTAQSEPGAVIPSRTLPDISLRVSSARIFPIVPALSTFQPETEGTLYQLEMTNPTWKKIADGAGMVFPFFLTTAPEGPSPSFADLQPLFPQNPGPIWRPVNPAFPGKSVSQMNAVHQGYSPFDSSGDPWAVQGDDRKDFWSVGYHEDWKWCHLGAYYARGDRNDLLYILPTVYRQAARPCHFNGLQVQFSIANFPYGGDQKYCFYMGRPGIWSVESQGGYLGRVPYPDWVQIAPNFMGWGEDVSDTRLWTGPDFEHASYRRLSEFAMATGSPWAWAEALYQGEIAKAQMRVMYQWGDSTRAFLAQGELAYRAYLLDRSDRSATDAAILAWERFLQIRQEAPWYLGDGVPGPLFAAISGQWLPGEWAAPAYEDLRAVPILLKLGTEFDKPNLIQAAMEVCQYYCTTGHVPGVGIKRHVNPLNPDHYTPPDYAGYHLPSGLGLRMASDYLVAHPMEGFDGNLYRQISDLIMSHAAGNQPGWIFF